MSRSPDANLNAAKDVLASKMAKGQTIKKRISNTDKDDDDYENKDKEGSSVKTGTDKNKDNKRYAGAVNDRKRKLEEFEELPRVGRRKVVKGKVTKEDEDCFTEVRLRKSDSI